jgi:hypothetical protein
MELTTLLALGGRFYLVAVTVGRDEDSQTVRDCLYEWLRLFPAT